MLENKMEQTIAQDELHEECGVFGIYDLDGQDVASTIYYGLFALQHRGQESCGIAVSETQVISVSVMCVILLPVHPPEKMHSR